MEVTIGWTEEAEMVRLAGVFNGWQPELMEREEGGGWARRLRLRPGRYQYKFVVGDQWRLDMDLPTVMDHSGNTNNVMELISTSQPQNDEALGEEKKNIGAEKTFFAATLQAQAMTMLRTQVSKANGPWVQKKFLQTLTLCMTIWMIVDMVLDWIFCYKFYQMCQVTVDSHWRRSS